MQTRKRIKKGRKPRSNMTVEAVEAVAKRAIAEGYGVPQYWQDNGLPRRLVILERRHNCLAPYPLELFGRYSSTHGKRVKPMLVRGEGRCRKCEPCKAYRAWSWQQRAIAEYKIWPRSYFGTFTLSPESHAAFDARAIRKLHAKGVNFALLTEAERFTARVAEFGLELTKWLKIVRNGPHRRLRRGEHGPVFRAEIRYLCVAEMHDSVHTSDEMRGRPHFHILVHEMRRSSIVLGDPEAFTGDFEKRFYKNKAGRWIELTCLKDSAFIRQKWSWGFTNFQLARNAHTASYLCKYLSKASLGRVRASEDYGFFLEREETKTSNG